jgi:hypothetical protein
VCGQIDAARLANHSFRFMWGPEKGRTDIEEGVGFEVVVPHSGALAVRRDGRVRQRVGAMRSLAV